MSCSFYAQQCVKVETVSQNHSQTFFPSLFSSPHFHVLISSMSVLWASLCLADKLSISMLWFVPLHLVSHKVNQHSEFGMYQLSLLLTLPLQTCLFVTLRFLFLSVLFVVLRGAMCVLLANPGSSLAFCLACSRIIMLPEHLQ